MKKGFTLIELLGVIAVLGIIASIAIPIIDNSIKQNRQYLYDTQISQIIKGAEGYYAVHLGELPKTEGATSEITIQKLQTEGNLDLNIVNPKTNEVFPPTTTIVVTKVGKNFKYSVKEAK